MADKNFRKFNGKPLYQYAIEAAKGCKEIRKVYYACINKLPVKAKWYKRSELSNSSDVSLEILLHEFTAQVKYDKLVILQATNPFTTSENVSEALSMMKDKDSVVSVACQRRFLWECNLPMDYNPWNRPLTQEFKGHLFENGAIYITTREQFLDSFCRIGGRIGMYEMPEYTYHEIDTQDDWIICQSLHKKYSKIQ